MRRPPTGEDGAALALLLHASLLLARLGEGRLKDKAADVVALLEVGLPLLQLLVVQVGRDVGHLDVGVLGVQVLGAHLQGGTLETAFTVMKGGSFSYPQLHFSCLGGKCAVLTLSSLSVPSLTSQREATGRLDL